jgi:hypothetical protein
MTATVQSFIAGDPSTDYRTRAKNYSWTDVDVPDVLRLDVPMELRLELRALSVWMTWIRNGSR